MVSNLVFYQLALIALGWLFLMLSWWWPSEPAAARPIPPTPVTPPRKRSTAPKPFPGLARKPHCDACEHATPAPTVTPPPAPPPQLVSTRGRRRHVDTTGLNLSHKLSFALSWRPLHRGGPPWHASTRDPVPMPSFGTARRSRCQRWKR